METHVPGPRQVGQYVGNKINRLDDKIDAGIDSLSSKFTQWGNNAQNVWNNGFNINLQSPITFTA
jgi:hypothetical protein